MALKAIINWVQVTTGNIYLFLFSDLKPAAWVHSVKLMDWIDSQQSVLQLGDESPRHFLSFPPHLLVLMLSSLCHSPPHVHPTVPPSSHPSAVPSSQHLINICPGFRSLSACRHLHADTCTVQDRREAKSPPACFHLNGRAACV